MPDDMFTRYYGHQCLKCGQQEREPLQKWCTSCLTASRRWHEQYAAEVAQEEYRYVSPERRRFLTPTPPPPPPTDPAPMRVCHHCSANAGWTDNGAGQWACAICGWPA
jgi:hypothetical protein